MPSSPGASVGFGAVEVVEIDLAGLGLGDAAKLGHDPHEGARNRGRKRPVVADLKC